jgi:hypothetical protein
MTWETFPGGKSEISEIEMFLMVIAPIFPFPLIHWKAR